MKIYEKKWSISDQQLFKPENGSCMDVNEVREALEAALMMFDESTLIAFGRRLRAVNGKVNDVRCEDDAGKKICVMQLAPYVNGSRSRDCSIDPSKKPMSIAQVLDAFLKIPGDALVKVDFKNPDGMGPHRGEILRAGVSEISVDPADMGVFMYYDGDQTDIIKQGSTFFEEDHEDEKFKIWIDDIRPAPYGYKTVQSVNQFIDFAQKAGIDNIVVVDIDHDAGDFQKDGGDYIKILDWLEFNKAENLNVRIHSANPVGAANMRRIIRKNGWTEIFDVVKEDEQDAQQWLVDFSDDEDGKQTAAFSSKQEASTWIRNREMQDRYDPTGFEVLKGPYLG